jgi:hypothetical protein
VGGAGIESQGDLSLHSEVGTVTDLQDYHYLYMYFAYGFAIVFVGVHIGVCLLFSFLLKMHILAPI